MKFIKLLIACVSVLASIAYAQPTEEFCHSQTEMAIRHKYYFNKYPDALSSSLKRLEESGLNKNLQTKIREDLFFIENRKGISDETFRTMMFVRCLRQQQ